MASIYFLTTVGTGIFVVPSDWNNNANTVECIGGGGAGASSTGGGGGGYAKSVNLTLTPGAQITYNVGIGGNVGSGGGSSWFNSSSFPSSGQACGAIGGYSGSDPSYPGVGGGWVGTNTNYQVGSLGQSWFGGNGDGIGGGGGAAGIHYHGGSAQSGTGGQADGPPLTIYGAPYGGLGGAHVSSGTASAGGAGTEWISVGNNAISAGSGGGGGGSSSGTGGTGGDYGGGGGAGGTNNGNGAQGIIVITNVPAVGVG